MKFGRELRVEGAYTVSEVARLLGISPTTVRAWIRRGKLRAFKFIHHQYLIPKGEVERIIKTTRGRKG